MKKHLLIIVANCMWLLPSTAQHPGLKEIETKIAAAKDDSVKLNLLIDAAEYLEYTDSANAFVYAEKAFVLAERLKDFEFAAVAINTKAIVHSDHEDYKRAITLYHIELAYMHQHHALKRLGLVYNNIGNAYLDLEQYDSTLFYYDKALAWALKTKATRPTAIAYSSLGNYYQTIGNFETATENHLMALKYKEQLKNLASIAHTQSNLMILFKDMGQLNDALFYGKAAEKNYLQGQNPQSLVILSVGLGQVYAKLKKYDSAIYYYQNALNYTTTISYSAGKQAAWNNLAIAYRFSGQPAKALAALDSAWNTITPGSAATVKFTIGTEYVNTYVELKQPGNAKRWVDTATKYVQVASDLTSRRNYQQMLTEYYAAAGDYPLAYKHQRLYEELKDSLLNEGNVKTVQLLKTKYETEKKENQIKEQQFLITKRNYIIIGFAGLILFVALLTWLLFKRYKLKQQQKLHEQQQQATIAILTAEEKERKRIASDLHDGVGQLMTAAWLNLQALNNQPEKEGNSRSQLLAKSLQLVDESCKEVRAVSHNMMPNALLKKGLVNAIREFIQQINARNISINLQADGLSRQLPDMVEIILYRVIQESVNNAVKHAQATRLDITIDQDESGIILLIEDNGKGFLMEEAVKKDGIGLQNIKSRIQFLNGTIEWDSSPDRGTLVSITIPPGG